MFEEIDRNQKEHIGFLRALIKEQTKGEEALQSLDNKNVNREKLASQWRIDPQACGTRGNPQGRDDENTTCNFDRLIAHRGGDLLQRHGCKTGTCL